MSDPSPDMGEFLKHRADKLGEEMQRERDAWLRDQIAIHAMEGLIASNRIASAGEDRLRTTEQLAYGYADAMMKERAK